MSRDIHMYEQLEYIIAATRPEIPCFGHRFSLAYSVRMAAVAVISSLA